MKKILFILLFLPVVCFSQMTSVSYYSAAVSAWIPTDIAGCELWLRGSDIVKDESDYVSEWTDLSGNLNHATQGTGANQPLWVDAQLNGEPVVRFDGNNDFMTMTQIQLLTGGSIFVVYKVTAANRGLMCTAGTYDDITINAVPACPTCTYVLSYTTNLHYGHYPSLPINSWGLMEIVLSPTTSEAWNNGVSQVFTMDSPQPITPKFNMIGFATYYAYFIGDIAELIIYDSALSDPDRVLVENYLNTKYAIY